MNRPCSHDKSESCKESNSSAQAPCFRFNKARFCNNGFFKVFHNFYTYFPFFSGDLDNSHNYLSLAVTVPTCKDKKIGKHYFSPTKTGFTYCCGWFLFNNETNDLRTNCSRFLGVMCYFDFFLLTKKKVVSEAPRARSEPM